MALAIIITLTKHIKPVFSKWQSQELKEYDFFLIQ